METGTTARAKATRCRRRLGTPPRTRSLSVPVAFSPVRSAPMKELTSINPFSLGSDKEIDKQGICAFDTAKKIHMLWEEKFEKIEEQFGGSDPARVVSDAHYQRTPFGTIGLPGDIQQFAPTVVSLALFDEDVQLFECTGIVIQSGTATNANGLTRFLTSARLFDIFDEKRNREDKLRIEVGVPLRGMGPINGFFELCDDHIAIVTSLLSHPGVTALDLDAQEIFMPTGSAVVALGRPFMLAYWMIQAGKLIEGPSEDDAKDLKISDCAIGELGLGGPLLSSDGTYFVGMNICCAKGKTSYLPGMVICERLKKYQIFTPSFMEHGDYSGQEETYGTNPSGEGTSSGIPELSSQGYSPPLGTKRIVPSGTSSGTPEIISQGYSPPPGAKRIIPSGFKRTIRWLEYMGYPMPPPLMLELNGELLDTFEDFFGYLHAWKGYLFNLSCCGDGANPWIRLRSNIVKDLSRRVVSLASFNDDRRLFACTGLLIKCRVGRCYGGITSSRTVILTSASLVRTCDATDTIDEKLRIEVFLPPNQRVSGKLEAYDSCYNLAVISAECLRVVCPEDVLLVDTTDQIRDRELRKLSREEPELKTVVAIGREPEEGLLCGSMGVVTKEPMKCGCKDLRLSTCKTKKAVIGGPLISFPDGSFVGMNFYDGRANSTPFLPRMYIVRVLRKLELPPTGRKHHVQRLDTPDGGTNYNNRWPVPKARWYNSILEEDKPFELRERQRI